MSCPHKNVNFYCMPAHSRTRIMMHLCYSAQLCPALSCRTWLSVARPTTSVRTSTAAGTSSALTPASWTTLAPERPSARSSGMSLSASARLGSRETRGSNADRCVRQTRKLTEHKNNIRFFNTFYIPTLFNKFLTGVYNK